MQRKKFLAVLLAATMTMGGSFSVLADGNTGSSTGTGESEGHVEQKTIEVVLPTVPADSTPFSYTMDLERLIQGTNGGKYASLTKPDAGVDTGVYFLTDGTYSYVADDTLQAGDDLSKHFEQKSGFVAAQDATAQAGTTYYTMTETDVEAGTDATSYFVEAIGGYVAATGDAQAGVTYYAQANASLSDGNPTDGYFESGNVYVAATGTYASGTYYKKTATALTYENTSKELNVTSKSSVDVKLKVEVTASKADTDVELVSAAPAVADVYELATADNGGADAEGKAVEGVTYYDDATGTLTDAETIEVGTTAVTALYVKTVSAAKDAQLYLGLTVGDEAPVAIEAGKTISKEVTIAGVANNFEVAVKDGEYVWGTKTSGLAAWNEVDFSISGAASKASAEGVTAPTLDVTWSWTEAEDETVEPTVAYAQYSSKKDKVWLDLSADVNGGITDASKLTSVTVAQGDGAPVDVVYTHDSSNWIFVTWANMEAAGCKWDKTFGDTYTFTFVYDGTTYVATVPVG